MPLGPRNPIARYRLVLEHAHSDLLEAAVDWGWPVASAGILILAAVWVWERWRKVERDPQAWAVEGFLVAMLAHSMVDMPFRPPFMQVEAVLALAWLTPAEPAEALRPAWPLRAALIAAFLLSLGAWLALPLKRDTGSGDPALAWRWSAPPPACSRWTLHWRSAAPWSMALSRSRGWLTSRMGRLGLGLPQCSSQH